MNNDVMFDLETLGTGPNAVILSIGACRFDINTGDIPASGHFHAVLDIDSNLAQKREIEGNTLLWWLDQSAEAQNSVFRTQTVPLLTALTAFAEYLDREPFARIWARGTSFDVSMLESAYRGAGMATPWKFWTVNCQRTLETVAQIDKLPREGTAHNALDDSIYQARSAIAQLQHLGMKHSYGASQRVA